MDSNLFALFQKRIEGDDALLALARHRFREAGLDPEFYAPEPGALRSLLAFHPHPENPCIVHLPRELDFLDPAGREFVAGMARTAPGRIRGCVVHDRNDTETRFETCVNALLDIDRRLSALPHPPVLFIEYAAGLDPDLFCRLVEAVREAPTLSACIDVGHVGIRQARAAYAARFPGHDMDAVDPASPEGADRLAGVREAVRSALPATIGLIRRLGKTGKPIHFHLHDGHPLEKNHYGVSDHRSFLAKIVVPSAESGHRELDTMYGPDGLKAILEAARSNIAPENRSFTLELHETLERRPLEPDVSALFDHWRDKTHAEKMNHWLHLILENAALTASLLRPH